MFCSNLTKLPVERERERERERESSYSVVHSLCKSSYCSLHVDEALVYFRTKTSSSYSRADEMFLILGRSLDLVMAAILNFMTRTT